MLSISSSKLRILSVFSHIVFARQKGNTLSGKALGVRDFIFPYHLSLDSKRKQIELKKRNWFALGVDSKTFNFGQVRNVLIDEHIITASLEVKVYAGNINVHWLRKRDAIKFRDALMSARKLPEGVGTYLE